MIGHMNRGSAPKGPENRSSVRMGRIPQSRQEFRQTDNIRVPHGDQEAKR